LENLEENLAMKTETLNRPIKSNESESVIKSVPKKKRQEQDSFTA
jgi:hypothetical protein